jgi:hypothetical protein
VTEYVDGGTLTDWANAETRTWRQIVELLTGFVSPPDNPRESCIEKVPVSGDPAVRVRCGAANMAVARNGSSIAG